MEYRSLVSGSHGNSLKSGLLLWWLSRFAVGTLSTNLFFHVHLQTGPEMLPAATQQLRAQKLKQQAGTERSRKATNAAMQLHKTRTYADERAKAAESLRQAMEMIRRTSTSEADASIATSDKEPIRPQNGQSHHTLTGLSRTESAAERARRLLVAAEKEQNAENLLLDHLKNGATNCMNARALYIPSSAESKRMSPARLVSLEVLNSFKSQSPVLHKSPSTVTVLESKTVQEKLEKEGASFVHFLTRVASTDRPMSARTRALLGKLPQNHAGNHAVNGSGMRGVLTNLKKTRATLAQDMTSVSTILKKSGSLLQRHFRGLSSRQLSERIYIAFQTYDTSNDGLLQCGELYEALSDFGMDVDQVEVGAFCDTYGTNGELNPKQFEKMVRVAMGLEHAERVEEEWKRVRSAEPAGEAAQTECTDGAWLFVRSSSAPDIVC